MAVRTRRNNAIFSFEITGGSDAVTADMGTALRRITRRAEIFGINKAIDKIFTVSKRRLREETGVKVSLQNIYKRRAKNRKRFASVWIGFKKMPKLGQLTSAKIYRGRGKYANLLSMGRRRVPPSEPIFRARMRSGHEGYFARRTKNRLKIDEITVDLSEVGTRIIHKTGNEYAEPVFRKEFERQQKRLLEKKGAA